MDPKKLLFAATTVVLVLVAIEVGSWATLSLVQMRLVSWRSLGADRDSVAREGIEGRSAMTAAEDPDLPPSWARGVRTDSIIHPYLGFVARPEPDLRERAPRYSPMAGNYGFPHNFHPIFGETDDNVVIVVVVGGSVAQQIGGVGRPFQYLDSALEATDRFHGKDVQVVNLALGGYKQPQQLMVLTYFLALGAEFDVVVNLDGFNEVTLPVRDNLDVGVNPFYPRAWRYRFGGESTRELNARGRVLWIDDIRKKFAGAASRRPWKWSFTATAVWWLVDERLRTESDRAQASVMSSAESEELEAELSGPKVDFENRDELFDALVESWVRCSRDIHGLAQTHDFEYYHFLQPNQYDAGSKPLSSEELRQAFDRESDFVDLVSQGYPRLRRESASLDLAGVVFRDLSRVFVDVDETLYIDTCCHLNTQGVSELVARIAATIGESPG